MKSLVLGATGFIGSHVARALVDEGIDVRVLSRGSGPSLALEGLKVERISGDLNDPDSLKKAMKGCQALFHVAGYYPLYSFDRSRQIEMALRQMKNALEAAESSGLQKVIYTSSMSTIGKTPDGNPSNEETPYDPKYFKGLYYEIKFQQEQMAFAYADRGLPIVIVNPTAVFGDYDVKPTSGAIVVAVAKKQVPLIFDALCNTIDVRDVARAQVAALAKGRDARRYILGAHNTSSWALTQLIARLAKVRPPMGRLPLFFGEGAAYLSEIAGRLLHQEKPLFPRVGIDFLKYGMHYDTSRAEKELGLKTTPLEETFERAIGWFRRNGYF